MTTVRLRRAIAGVAATVVGLFAVVEWLLALLRPEGGPLGVLQLAAPHMAIAGLATAALIALAPPRAGVLATLALAIVVAGRFGGEWLSLPGAARPAGAIPITVVTWNLEVLSRSGADSVAFLRAADADVIALQEFEPDVARAIQGDQQLAGDYPYRALEPRTDVLGLGILSRFPIVASSVELGPAVQRVELDTGSGRLIVFNVHPLHGELESLGDTRLPVGIDVARRNNDLVAIRTRVDAEIAAGRPTIVMGDLNTTSSEPAFDRLVAGLRDVHAEVGEGTGWTWRPIRLEALGLGLIRIDHVISSPDIRSHAIAERCPPIGDHCLVRAELSLGSG